MKIKNLILCAALLLVAVGCNQPENNGGTPTTANTNAPVTTNAVAGTNATGTAH